MVRNRMEPAAGAEGGSSEASAQAEAGTRQGSADRCCPSLSVDGPPCAGQSLLPRVRVCLLFCSC